MPQTAAYQSSPNSNNVLLSYGVEATWGTLPAVQFRQLRYFSESLSGTKMRGRPPEAGRRSAAAAVTMRESAGGTISVPLAYGVHDDLLGTALGNDWAAPLNISNSTIFTTGPNIVSASTPDLFQNIVQGDFVRLSGFTNPLNNCIGQVIFKVSNTQLSVHAFNNLRALVTEAAGARTIRNAGVLLDGEQFQSLFFQKRLSANQFLRYPGGYITRCTLNASLGNFLSIEFEVAAREEARSATEASTGAVIAAPQGRVHDPVGGFLGMVINAQAFDVAPRMESIAINVANEGAEATFELGSAAANGMLEGTFTASGQMTAYFQNFDLYDRFKSEVPNIGGFVTRDAAGAAYGIGFESCNLLNPRIVAGGQNQRVMAQFDLELNPGLSGRTMRVTRIAA